MPLTGALEGPQKGKPQVDVRFESAYAGLPDKDAAAVFGRLDEILALLREHRPELLKGVSTINLYFGDKLARTIRVAGEAKR